MLGLALMAARLAGERVKGDPNYVFDYYGRCHVGTRKALEGQKAGHYAGSREYYRIINKITANWKAEEWLRARGIHISSTITP